MGLMASAMNFETDPFRDQDYDALDLRMEFK